MTIDWMSFWLGVGVGMAAAPIFVAYLMRGLKR